MLDQPRDHFPERAKVSDMLPDLSDSIPRSRSVITSNTGQAESSGAAVVKHMTQKSEAVEDRTVRQIMKEAKSVRRPHNNHDLEGMGPRGKIAIHAMRTILDVHKTETERAKANAISIGKFFSP